MVYYAANLLKIKPVIYMNEQGRMVIREKHRGEQANVLGRYIKQTFEKYPNPDLSQLYISYTTYNEAVQARMLELVAQYHKFEKIQFNYCSCNCAVHSGRNTVAMFYMCE
jgi:fatty acid-binding protein DegV